MWVSPVLSWAGARRDGVGVQLTRLRGIDLHDWIALRRVSDREILRMQGHWYGKGGRLPCYVTETLERLHKAGMVELAAVTAWTTQHAGLTAAGEQRYAQLCG
jgi:hypothetical protein